MKKSLVLAMAMALGVTASAYAANPFSDVPAGHWAYDSISKLAAAGVVEGYPDGSFKGDNLMTRYEMAQIVAKAMAKGANVDALAAEFADELDNLGVRVAALEKKADNVKITGEARYNYKHVTEAADSDALRTRLWFAGQVNEDWTYTAMLENNQNFKSNDAGDEDTKFQRAYADGKIGGLKVRAGRYHWETWAPTQSILSGDIYGNRVDAIQASYGKAVKIQAAAGKMTAYNGGYNDFWAADISTKLGKAATLNVGYYDINADAGVQNKEIIDIGLKANLGKNVVAAVDWMKANSDDNTIDGNKAYIAALSYKGAKASQVGSWGLKFKWVDAEKGMLKQAWNSDPKVTNGEGYGVGAYYTLAKNIVAGVEYFSLDTDKKANGRQETLWSQVILTF